MKFQQSFPSFCMGQSVTVISLACRWQGKQRTVRWPRSGNFPVHWWQGAWAATWLHRRAAAGHLHKQKLHRQGVFGHPQFWCHVRRQLCSGREKNPLCPEDPAWAQPSSVSAASPGSESSVSSRAIWRQAIGVYAIQAIPQYCLAWHHEAHCWLLPSLYQQCQRALPNNGPYIQVSKGDKKPGPAAALQGYPHSHEWVQPGCGAVVHAHLQPWRSAAGTAAHCCEVPSRTGRPFCSFMCLLFVSVSNANIPAHPTIKGADVLTVCRGHIISG